MNFFLKSTSLLRLEQCKCKCKMCQVPRAKCHVLSVTYHVYRTKCLVSCRIYIWSNPAGAIWSHAYHGGGADGSGGDTAVVRPPAVTRPAPHSRPPRNRCPSTSLIRSSSEPCGPWSLRSRGTHAGAPCPPWAARSPS